MSIGIDQRTLRLGDVGEDVRRLQGSLNGLDYGPIAEDGNFGPETQAAVMRYQSNLGLPVDGIVGPDTWARIMHDLGN